MDTRQIFNMLDALFAFDVGATDSGVHDDTLEKETFDAVRALTETERVQLLDAFCAWVRERVLIF